jgi:hypothetical protein
MTRKIRAGDDEGWLEEDFQKWFIAHPELPGVGHIAVLGEARSGKRMPDIIGVTKAGTLVTIEVKNTYGKRRTLLGQMFEYIARFEGVREDWLEKLCGFEPGTYERACRAKFGSVPKLTAKREVFLVAPSFGVGTSSALWWLREVHPLRNITIRTFITSRSRGEFSLEEYDPNSVPIPGRYYEWLRLGNGGSRVLQVTATSHGWTKVLVEYCSGCIPSPKYEGQPTKEWMPPFDQKELTREEWEDYAARAKAR